MVQFAEARSVYTSTCSKESKNSQIILEVVKQYIQNQQEV